jgi:hypothetical protein
MAAVQATTLINSITRRAASCSEDCSSRIPSTTTITLWKADAGIYESDCHEHNYGLANILSAARAEEKKK